MKNLSLSADNISVIIEMLEESIKAAQEAVKADYLNVIRFENYKYNIGRIHALLDILQAADMDLFCEHFESYIERTEECEKEINDKIYTLLRNAECEHKIF